MIVIFVISKIFLHDFNMIVKLKNVLRVSLTV